MHAQIILLFIIKYSLNSMPKIFDKISSFCIQLLYKIIFFFKNMGKFV